MKRILLFSLLLFVCFALTAQAQITSVTANRLATAPGTLSGSCLPNNAIRVDGVFTVKVCLNGTWAAALTGTASSQLDTIGSTRGSILYRGASGWAILTPGASGTVLQSNGAGADPSYATVSAGANTALSNLASVSINSALLFQTGVNIGSTAAPPTDLYFKGSGTFGSHSIKLTGAPAGHRTATFPDSDTTIPIASQQLTFSGPTAARTITLYDANFSAARINDVNTFTGLQTFTTGIRGGTGSAAVDAGFVYAGGFVTNPSGTTRSIDIGYNSSVGITLRSDGKLCFFNTTDLSAGGIDTCIFRGGGAGITEFNRGTAGTNVGARINAVSSGVNFPLISSSTTGNPVKIEPDGSDTNVTLDLLGKGTGNVRVNGFSLAITNVAVTASAGAALSLNLSTGNQRTVTFGAGNITDLTATNIPVGNVTIILIQDGTGSRTANWDNNIFKFSAATEPTLTTTAGAVDVFEFACNGTVCRIKSSSLDVR